MLKNKNAASPIEYDEAKGFFILEGTQISWTAAYLLSKSRTGLSLKDASEDLDPDFRKTDILEEEIQGLKRIGLVKEVSGRYRLTEKGQYVLGTVFLKAGHGTLRINALKDLKKLSEEFAEIDAATEKPDQGDKWRELPAKSNLPFEFKMELLNNTLISGALVVFTIFVIFLFGSYLALIGFAIGLVIGYYPGVRRYSEGIQKKWYLTRRNYFARVVSLVSLRVMWGG